MKTCMHIVFFALIQLPPHYSLKFPLIPLTLVTVIVEVVVVVAV